MHSIIQFSGITGDANGDVSGQRDVDFFFREYPLMESGQLPTFRSYKMSYPIDCGSRSILFVGIFL